MDALVQGYCRTANMIYCLVNMCSLAKRYGTTLARNDNRSIDIHNYLCTRSHDSTT